MFFGNTKKDEVAKKTLSKKQEEIQKIAGTVKQEVDLVPNPIKNVSILNNLLSVKGDIEGGGSLIIGGDYEGNLSLNDTVFVEDGAKVTGNIRANSIKISGEVKGNIDAKVVEITKNGSLEGNIKATITSISGLVNGSILSLNSVEIRSSGVLDAKECKAQKVKVVGKILGKVIASELLEVISGGSVNGSIITKSIRTEEGGSIIGNIQTYDPEKHAVKEENKSTPVSSDIDPEISKLINIDPKDLQKYAKKGDKKGGKKS